MSAIAEHAHATHGDPLNALAFFFGCSLTSLPLLRSGLALATRVAPLRRKTRYPRAPTHGRQRRHARRNDLPPLPWQRLGDLRARRRAETDHVPVVRRQRRSRP